MKRAINSIIALLSLLCLIGAVKLSSLPLWSSFSENSFWYTSPTVRESFSLLYDMFVGFLLSAVFYFGVEVLPEILKLHRGKKLICNYINILLENMEQIISITTQVFQIDTTKIYLKDLVRLSGNTTHSHEEVSMNWNCCYSSTKETIWFGCYTSSRTMSCIVRNGLFIKDTTHPFCRSSLPNWIRFAGSRFGLRNENIRNEAT